MLRKWEILKTTFNQSLGKFLSSIVYSCLSDKETSAFGPSLDTRYAKPVSKTLYLFIHFYTSGSIERRLSTILNRREKTKNVITRAHKYIGGGGGGVKPQFMRTRWFIPCNIRHESLLPSDARICFSKICRSSRPAGGQTNVETSLFYRHMKMSSPNHDQL